MVNTEDIAIMHAIDEIYTNYPFYGSRRVRYELDDAYDIIVGREKVQKLMRNMGISAIYPKKSPNTSGSHPEHKIYPYLLKQVTTTYPNHVWGTDITYIRLLNGFIYLVAILDWYSRYIIAWRLSDTMETTFCIETLTDALKQAQPHIHNSDQGSQFTAHEYIDTLKAYPTINISMDGRGRCFDNIFTERLWRTIKYEHIYLHDYATIEHAKQGIAQYIHFYNTKRPHQSLDYQTPAAVYFN